MTAAVEAEALALVDDLGPVRARCLGLELVRVADEIDPPRCTPRPATMPVGPLTVRGAGARPGELIARRSGDGRWLAYRVGRRTVAAAYVGARLVRRDVAGWWTAGAGGERVGLPADRVAALAPPPAGWPVLAEQAGLARCGR